MSDIVPISKNLLKSTLWLSEDKNTRLVWVAMLLLRNRDHMVLESIPGLADYAKVSIDECKLALMKLKKPDEYSKSRAYDGRRIVDVEGGWLIVNGSAYHKASLSELKREYQREWARGYRQRLKEQSKEEEQNHEQ